MNKLQHELSPEFKRELLGEQEPQQEQENTISWPEPLAEEAFHGLAGEIVRTIEPHTEADPAALLFSLLGLYGNAIGRNAHFIAEADEHYMNLFISLVGATAKGRKGVSFGQIKRLFEAIDENWARNRVTQGLSSGEGLIWAVRDEQRTTRKNKDGEEEEIILVDGVDDKRLTVVEAEFASTIRVLKREGNTLSAVIRKGWDDGALNSLTKNSQAQATGAHISLLCHITKDELLRYLDSTEAANGFGNRFLWGCVKRSKCLPEGGKLHKVDFTDILRRLTRAVEHGRVTGEIKRYEEARQLWHVVYPELSEGKPGMFGAMIARAEAQVMRLAAIYALLDLSNIVKMEHLKAGLACWKYAEDSAKFIFGEAMGDPLADETLRVLRN
ncbi:MAG: DUF3987 domain-containing protein, partial [Candidatus Syntrophonatronum acetioxidans]